ncbi:MAG: formimidoylglutamase [Balneolaceae bacterium]|nr:formimidoylglutamase [Balneolaceae bacterium]
MSQLKKEEIPLPEPDDEDPRIGHLLGKKLSGNSSPRAVIVGFPSDEGVRRNGGRPGAADAPLEIRKMLYKMTPDAESGEPFKGLIEHTNDIGDVEVLDDVEADQEVLGNIVAGYLEQEVVPIIMGGGHETAFGHFLGYAKAQLETAIFNLDAHTDVRPLKNGQAHSGSPFRQAMEHESGCCSKYLVAGLQPNAVAESHLHFIDHHSGQYHFKDATNITTISGLFHAHDAGRLMVTFDMDAVDQAFAPGVSAPCGNGVQPDLWLTAAYLAGRNEKVTSFDVSEVNPKYDRDHQAARLAALTIWHFLLGLSQR